MRENVMVRKAPIVLGVVLCMCCTVVPVSAGMVDIGGNWRASWDPSLDPYVSISANGVINDVVYIEKSAEFIQGPVGGIFPSIAVVFQQTGASAVTNIVLDDEIITNSTGVDWIDFHFEILNGTDAQFNPTATGNSGGGPPIGWSISPFKQAAFTGNLMGLDAWDGVVPDGSLWFPGDGATNGQLWIDVLSKTSSPYTVFTVKEAPTPEPSTLSLVGLCALGILRKRRH